MLATAEMAAFATDSQRHQMLIWVKPRVESIESLQSRCDVNRRRKCLAQRPNRRRDDRIGKADNLAFIDTIGIRKRVVAVMHMAE